LSRKAAKLWLNSLCASAGLCKIRSDAFILQRPIEFFF